MCNQWTNEHTFIWCGNTTTDARALDNLLCVCKKLTMKQANELALKALYDAESRRQKEREQEAKWYMDDEA